MTPLNLGCKKYYCHFSLRLCRWCKFYCYIFILFSDQKVTLNKCNVDTLNVKSGLKKQNKNYKIIKIWEYKIIDDSLKIKKDQIQSRAN